MLTLISIHPCCYFFHSKESFLSPIPWISPSPLQPKSMWECLYSLSTVSFPSSSLRPFQSSSPLLLQNHCSQGHPDLVFKSTVSFWSSFHLTYQHNFKQLITSSCLTYSLHLAFRSQYSLIFWPICLIDFVQSCMLILPILILESSMPQFLVLFSSLSYIISVHILSHGLNTIYIIMTPQYFDLKSRPIS